MMTEIPLTVVVTSEVAAITSIHLTLSGRQVGGTILLPAELQERTAEEESFRVKKELGS